MSWTDRPSLMTVEPPGAYGRELADYAVDAEPYEAPEADECDDYECCDGCGGTIGGPVDAAWGSVCHGHVGAEVEL